MAYKAEISRSNPSCFVFLIDQSGSMSDTFGVEGGKTKADGVADAINRLLQNLVIKCTKSEGVRDYYDVAVIGYGASVGPAFAGELAGQELAKISQVANAPAVVEERSRKVEDGAGGLVEETIKFPVWFKPVANGGTPMCQALQFTHRMLSGWILNHGASYPPIVINITDGESTDGDPEPESQAIRDLSTLDGSVLMFNCHVSSAAAASVVYPPSEAGLPDQFASLLFRMSSVLPDNIRAAAAAEGLAATPESRGFAFNADLVELIRFLDIGTRPSNLR